MPIRKLSSNIVELLLQACTILSCANTNACLGDQNIAYDICCIPFPLDVLCNEAKFLLSLCFAGIAAFLQLVEAVVSCPGCSGPGYWQASSHHIAE